MKKIQNEEPDKALSPLNEIFRKLVPALMKGGSSLISAMRIAILPI